MLSPPLAAYCQPLVRSSVSKHGRGVLKSAGVRRLQVMALIADFMLVWLPAPTLSFGAQKVAKQGKLQSFLRSCPDNAFQARRVCC